MCQFRVSNNKVSGHCAAGVFYQSVKSVCHVRVDKMLPTRIWHSIQRVAKNTSRSAVVSKKYTGPPCYMYLIALNFRNVSAIGFVGFILFYFNFRLTTRMKTKTFRWLRPLGLLKVQADVLVVVCGLETIESRDRPSLSLDPKDVPWTNCLGKNPWFMSRLKLAGKTTSNQVGQVLHGKILV